jgi:general secretion pathway protein H
MATTPTSVPGSKRRGAAPAALPRRGFTLLELLVVVALIALASSVMVLALRDPGAAQLEREAMRLAALLESARAESRLAGLEIRWRPGIGPGAGFSFIPSRRDEPWPTAWLGEGVSAEVADPRGLSLGPEPVIGAQRVVLRLGEQRLVLATDGIAAFTITAEASDAR